MRITSILNETYTEEGTEGLIDNHFAVFEDGTKVPVEPRARAWVFRAFEQGEDVEPDELEGRRGSRRIERATEADLDTAAAPAPVVPPVRTRAVR